MLRDNEHYPLKWERFSRKQNCSLMHFLEVSKTIYSIIQQLKGCMVWLPTVPDLKVYSGIQFLTPACSCLIKDVDCK